jgi:DNA-binding NarL/FixJ family response regulator
MTLRVIVADDHEAVREGLRWMLKADDRVEVVADAPDGRSLLDIAARVPCDAILLDLSMPGMDGIAVLAELGAAGDMPAVIVLTMHDDPVSVDRALALGASGYVLKSAPRDELIHAIESAVAGGAYVQPSLAKPLLARHLSPVGPTPEAGVALPPRHLQLLRRLAAGRSNKELAHELGLSEATVKGYLKELYARLDVRSRAEAVAYGLRTGLIR